MNFLNFTDSNFFKTNLAMDKQEGGAKKRKSKSANKKTTSKKTTSPKPPKSPRSKPAKKCAVKISYVHTPNGLVIIRKKMKGGMSSMPMDITNPSDDMFLLNKSQHMAAINKNGYDDNYTHMMNNNEMANNFYANPAKYGDDFQMKENIEDVMPEMEGGRRKKRKSKSIKGGCGCAARKDTAYTYGGSGISTLVQKPQANTEFEKQFLIRPNVFNNSANCAYTAGIRDSNCYTLGGKKKKPVKKPAKKPAKKPTAKKGIQNKNKDSLLRMAKACGVPLYTKKNGKKVVVKKSTLVKNIKDKKKSGRC